MKYSFYGWQNACIKDERGLTPRGYYDLLSGIWCAETCAPRMRADWSRDNRTLGQCSITAFLMQDIYGGKVYGVPLEDGNYHCFNVVETAEGTCLFDLTSEQFGGRVLDYENCPEQFREVHFKKEEKRKRYELLKQLLEKRISSLTFRFAEESDCALLLGFIRKLAEYEKMTDQVTATEEKLRQSIFRDHKAEVIFICEDAKEVGYALFFSSYSTFLGHAGMYLEDLFILPEYRGKGYGRATMRKLAGIAVERGYDRLEWSCLDWNRPGIDFYLSLGASAMDDWTVYRLSGRTLREAAE